MHVTHVCHLFDAVINELDGLSKGCRDRQYEFAEHADMVRTGARAAMGFLEKEFESRNSSLRALTSEGTVMDTIAFRSEQSKDVVCIRLH
jgi:protein SMG6